MCVLCVTVFVCVREGGTRRVQKGVSGTLELELQLVISHLTWVLRTDLGPLQVYPDLVTDELASQCKCDCCLNDSNLQLLKLKI